MMIRIEGTKDTGLLADLNRDVQDLHANTYPDLFRPYDKAEVAKFFDSTVQKGNWSHYVAYDDEDPVGFIQIEKRQFMNHPFRKDCGLVYIHQICVRKAYEGKGVGKMLIEKARAFAKEHGIDRIELDVWALNQRGNGFFERMGFSTYKRQMMMKV